MNSVAHVVALPYRRLSTQVFALIALVLVLYWPSTQSLAELWLSPTNDTYSYGTLVAALTVWMLWRRRARLDALERRPNIWPAFALLVVTPLWLLSDRAGIQTGHEVLLPAIVWLAVFAFFGARAARFTAFPVAYFYLAVPLWGAAIDVLRWFTTHVVYALLRLSGIDSHLEHPLILIREGAFEVGAGCAGLNFALIAVAVAALYGELLHVELRRRISLIAIAVVAGLCANWLRVYIIVVAGHLTNMQHYLVTTSHYGFGWALFAVIMCAYLYILKPGAQDATTAQAHASRKSACSHSTLRPTATVAAALAAFSLAAVPALSLGHQFRGRASVTALLPQIATGQWSARTDSVADWTPRFRGADAEAKASYFNGDALVDVYRAVYAEQYQDKELVNEENDPGVSKAEILSANVLTAAGKPFNELRLKDAQGREWLLWYHYAVDGQVFVSGLREQLGYALHSLWRQPVSSVTVMRTACGTDCLAARQRLTELIAVHSNLRGGIS